MLCKGYANCVFPEPVLLAWTRLPRRTFIAGAGRSQSPVDGRFATAPVKGAPVSAHDDRMTLPRWCSSPPGAAWADPSRADGTGTSYQNALNAFIEQALEDNYAYALTLFREVRQLRALLYAVMAELRPQ
jgi:hypothetical protein